VNGWLFVAIDTGKLYHANAMRQRHLNKAAASREVNSLRSALTAASPAIDHLISGQRKTSDMNSLNRNNS